MRTVVILAALLIVTVLWELAHLLHPDLVGRQWTGLLNFAGTFSFIVAVILDIHAESRDRKKHD
jgi:hypothetical protein